jgi:hypothetical protein
LDTCYRSQKPNNDDSVRRLQVDARMPETRDLKPGEGIRLPPLVSGKERASHSNSSSPEVLSTKPVKSETIPVTDQEHVKLVRHLARRPTREPGWYAFSLKVSKIPTLAGEYPIII